MLDFANVGVLLDPEERQIRESIRRFVDAEVIPGIEEWWRDEVLPRHLVAEFGKLGLLGANLPEEYGGAGLNSTAYGLMMYELERGDSGLRSFVSVQNALVMYPIFAYGSEEQRREYLPRLASGEIIGCFGLTEHDGGSDPGAMRTRARRDGDDWILNGSKMWITNGHIADVAVVWAADEDGGIIGFAVDTDTPGFSANKVRNKFSLRASETSELVFEDMRVPSSAQLPGAAGLKAPLGCLTQARYGIAWGALGALEAVYQEALEFAQSRITFGQPIASRQLVQDKLVNMVADHTNGLLLAWHLSKLKDSGQLKHPMVSLGKRQNVRSALVAARNAREILGANGITLEYHTIRHMLNLETVDTYEGTYDIHTLIIGRELTGFGALG
jgi:glutaryl-CoA dehydrogenase